MCLPLESGVDGGRAAFKHFFMQDRHWGTQPLASLIKQPDIEQRVRQLIPPLLLKQQPAVSIGIG